jgi:hypothetical protein
MDSASATVVSRKCRSLGVQHLVQTPAAADGGEFRVERGGDLDLPVQEPQGRAPDLPGPSAGYGPASLPLIMRSLY